MSAPTLTREESVTVPKGLVSEATARTGRRVPPAPAAEVSATHLELNRLAEYLAWAEVANGPVTQETRDQVHAMVADADAAAGYTP